MGEATEAGLRERIAEAIEADAERPREEHVSIVNALLPVVQGAVDEQTARLRAELAAASQDAERGWADAEGQQNEAVEWAQLWKSWKGYAEQLQAQLADATAGITAAVRQRKQAEERARKAEAAIARVRAVLREGQANGWTGMRYHQAVSAALPGAVEAP